MVDQRFDPSHLVLEHSGFLRASYIGLHFALCPQFDHVLLQQHRDSACRLCLGAFDVLPVAIDVHLGHV